MEYYYHTPSYQCLPSLVDFVDIEEGVPVPVVLHDEFRTGMDQKCNTFIGHVNIHDRTSWEDMDGKILAIFKVCCLLVCLPVVGMFTCVIIYFVDCCLHLLLVLCI